MAEGEGVTKEEEIRERHQQPKQNELKSSSKFVPCDSFDVETGRVPGNHRSHQATDWGSILKLAFQSVGVVYGDIGTSPLYTLPTIFSNGVQDNEDILGILSLIFYSLTIVTVIKYVFIVLSANDNGDGGTFALYSLICRYAKVGLISNTQPEDKDVSNYRLDAPDRRQRRASMVKSMLEKSESVKYLLLLMTMLGTSMVLGDGILTPSISVLSAVGGIKEAASSLNQTKIMWISVVILIILFQVQRFGTDKVGYSFAPIVTIWFLFIGIIGLYNFVKYDPGVIKAINPVYIINYFSRNKTDAWISLGGVVLCLTGSEALFADLGHFSVRSIQISTCTLVYPALLLAYTGQSAYLRKHNLDAPDLFFKSIPGPVYWPMFVVAVLAAIIASQALISASFSIIQQSLALGCFPRVKIVHTSTKFPGQVYIPEINHLLMLACIGVTLGFKNTLKIGNAYGIAVVFVMTLTSALLILVMVMIWKTNIFLIIIYCVTIYLIELIFLSSVLYKFVDGGYLPLAFAAILMMIMYTWHYVYRRKYLYDLENKVVIEKLKEIASDPSIRRLPGLALFHSELVHGISPIFTHYIANIPALHSVLVFVSIKFLPISKVPAEERFLFQRVKPNELAIFRCVVRYGYKDENNEQESFEEMLVGSLKEFIRENLIKFGPPEGRSLTESDPTTIKIKEEEIEKEVHFVENECKNGGVVHLMGENEVVASTGSSLGKRVTINYAYNILKRCIRQHEEVFTIPRKRLLKVGMTYEL